MDSEKDTLNIQSIIQKENLPETVVKALERADIDKNGELSLEEIVLVLQDSDKANKERQMFKWLCIVCTLGFLIIVATMGGAIYGLVELTDNVKSDDDILMSKSKEPLSAGLLYTVQAAEQLFDQDPKSVMQTESIALSNEDGSILYQRVAEIEIVPGIRAEITTTSGDAYVITAEGITRREENPGGLVPRVMLGSWDMTYPSTMYTFQRFSPGPPISYSPDPVWGYYG